MPPEQADVMSPWVSVLIWVLLLGTWTAWWLGAVNWSKVWPVLSQGAWAPVVLLVLTIAMVWAAISPGACTCIPGLKLPNFWWQLLAVGGLTLFTFCCGWLQGWLGWVPPEIAVEPPPEAHDPIHMHAHAHDEHGHEEEHPEEHEEHGHGHH
jgi:hypothetical protein